MDKKGTFILKPQNPSYPFLPENEDLTMKLARTVDIEVPIHGMLWGSDAQLTYFIKRFDRGPRGIQYAVEDFAQLSNLDRETKYNSSMENVLKVIEKFCTFPDIEKVKLLTRVIFCFLTGNEDMHIKNFSLITEKGIIQLSPAYDLVNTTLALVHAKEELALSLRGRKNNLTRQDFVKYFAKERMKLPDMIIARTLKRIETVISAWPSLIHSSFLPEDDKQKYLELVNERWERVQK